MNTDNSDAIICVHLRASVANFDYDIAVPPIAALGISHAKPTGA
jgi:hypothetical protein